MDIRGFYHGERPVPRKTVSRTPCQTEVLGVLEAGGRSLRAAQLLDAHGYENVVNVKGGFGGAMDPRTGVVVERGWRDAHLPIEATAASGARYADLLAKATQAR